MYEIVEVIGTGGFGTVYRARHGKTHREVALKVLHPERCADVGMVERFMDEARTVNKLALSGVVDIFDFGTHGGSHYLVMELLRGKSLATILDERLLAFDESVALLHRIAEIVDALHAAGASHRDLKPANIMVIGDGGVKVIDFGLAKLAHDVDRTVTREAFGTPGYMAPEQCRGLGADARSDRYSFGVLAYRMLAGRLPFEGEALSVALAHVDTQPRRPSQWRRLPAGVDEGVLALLAKHPEKRPTKLVPVVDQLTSRRFPVQTVAAVTIVLALAGGAGYLALRDTRPPPIDPATVQVVRSIRMEIASLISLTRDGTAIDVTTARGVARVPWVGEPAPADPGTTYRTWLPDGRYVDSTDGVISAVAADGTRTMLGTGNLPEACPDGSRLAMFSNEVLHVVDMASGAARELVKAPGAWGVRWSPSCKSLLWTNWEGAHLTTLDGSTTLLPIEPFRPLNSYAAAAFLDDDVIAYCGRTDRGAEMRAHYLDGRAHDSSLFALDPLMAGCNVTTSIDGRRIAVDEVAFQISLRIRSRQGTYRSLFDDRSGTARVLAFTDEDHVLIATWPIAKGFGAGPITAVAPATFEEVSLDGTRRPETPCGDTIAATSYRGTVALIALEGETFVLRRPKTCEVVGRFTPPKAKTWSVPSCAGEICVAAALEGNDLVARQLAPITREIARVPQEPTGRDVEPAPMVELSPDGAHLVMFRLLDSVAHLVALAKTPAPLEIRAGRGANFPFSRALWDGDSEVVLSNPAANNLYRATLDGKVQRFDQGDFVYARSPSGDRVAVGFFGRESRLVFAEKR